MIVKRFYDGDLSITVSRALTFLNFTAIDTKALTEDEAAQKQTEMGWMPQGYGFWGYRTEQKPNGIVATYWRAHDSCD